MIMESVFKTNKIIVMHIKHNGRGLFPYYRHRFYSHDENIQFAYQNDIIDNKLQL